MIPPFFTSGTMGAAAGVTAARSSPPGAHCNKAGRHPSVTVVTRDLWRTQIDAAGFSSHHRHQLLSVWPMYISCDIISQLFFLCPSVFAHISTRGWKFQEAALLPTMEEGKPKSMRQERLVSYQPSPRWRSPAVSLQSHPSKSRRLFLPLRFLCFLF